MTPNHTMNEPVSCDRIWQLLGRSACQISFVKCDRQAEKIDGSMRIEELLFTSSTGEHISAVYISPVNKPRASPAILYCHAHGHRYDIGCSELLDGRPALWSAYARDLIALGFTVLCVEMPCFGDRKHLGESATAKACLWRGSTLFGWMLAELVASLDFMVAQEHIDAERIGVLGISMGGTHAWWLAALDERVRATVSLCCFADLDCLIDTGQHEGHGPYMTVPGLLEITSSGQLAGLTAPRAQFIGVGLQDWSTPEACFERGRTQLQYAYEQLGAQDQLVFHIERETGHIETQAMRSRVLAFLQKQLGSS